MKNKAQFEGFFVAGEALSPDAPSYVERQADRDLVRLAVTGEYCTVLTSRQMGMSSLVQRTGVALQTKGVHVVAIDLRAISDTDAEGWYFGLVSEISRQLRLGIDEYRWWVEREQLGPVQRFTDFLKEVVLKEVSAKIVIFVDEIDSTLRLPFTDDFFVSIRALYNERASSAGNKRLTFVLVGVARPADLIKDRRRTPYNIGRTIELRDFTREEASTFLQGLRQVSPRQAGAILDRVLFWTEGHPYLTQKVCAAVVEDRGRKWSQEQVDQLVGRLFFQEGRIQEETNLQRIDEYIRTRKHRDAILQTYRGILSGKQVRDEEGSIEKGQLKLSGLVKASPQGYLQVRNPIYEHVFGLEWADSTRSGIPWSKVVFSALAAVLLIAIAVVAYRYVVGRSGTPTPEPSPSFTATQAAVIVPTSTLLPSTQTDTPTSTLTPTMTPVETKITTRASTDTPTLTYTPLPSSTSTAMPTATSTPSPSSTPTATPTSPTSTPVVIVVTATPTPTPGLLPPPVLVEPEGGASFPKVVRLKWIWPHRLKDHERFAIRWEPTSGQKVDDWWVSEVGIIGGGGAIHSVEGEYRFEVNLGLDPYPEGEAYWSVAVFREEPYKVLVSQWSERRLIFKRARP